MFVKHGRPHAHVPPPPISFNLNFQCQGCRATHLVMPYVTGSCAMYLTCPHPMPTAGSVSSCPQPRPARAPAGA